MVSRISNNCCQEFKGNSFIIIILFKDVVFRLKTWKKGNSYYLCSTHINLDFFIDTKFIRTKTKRSGEVLQMEKKNTFILFSCDCSKNSVVWLLSPPAVHYKSKFEVCICICWLCWMKLLLLSKLTSGGELSMEFPSYLYSTRQQGTVTIMLSICIFKLIKNCWILLQEWKIFLETKPNFGITANFSF